MVTLSDFSEARSVVEDFCRSLVNGKELSTHSTESKLLRIFETERQILNYLRGLIDVDEVQHGVALLLERGYFGHPRAEDKVLLSRLYGAPYRGTGFFEARYRWFEARGIPRTTIDQSIGGS